MSGWVKLHRKLIDSEVFCDAGLLKVWLYCLVKANHEALDWTTVIRGSGTVRVKVLKGQFIWGRNRAGKELRMNSKTAERMLQRLQIIGNVSLQVSKQFSTVTICNWDTYQNGEKSNVPPTVPLVSHHCPTDVPLVSTNKNEKKLENEKKEEETSPRAANDAATGDTVKTPEKEAAPVKPLFDTSEPCDPFSPPAKPSAPSDRPKKTKKPGDPRIREFVDWYAVAYETHFGKKYIFGGGKDAAAVKALMHLDDATLHRGAEAMWADSFGCKDPSLAMLRSKINQWLKPATVTRPLNQTEKMGNLA